MILVFGHDAAVADWVAERIPHMNGQFRDFAAIGVAESGKLVAGVVYHDHYPRYRHIQISMAADSPRWAQRGVIRGLLAYPFVQLGCERVTLTVPHTSHRVLKFTKGIGFVSEGVLRRGFGDAHAVVLGMLSRDYHKLMNRLHPPMAMAG